MPSTHKTKIAGFNEYEFQYDTGGHPVDAGVEDEAIDYFAHDAEGRALQNLIVISHGWNNDIADARDLYGRFFNALGAQLDAAGRDRAAAYGVIGVFWPSKKFAEADLIPGGAAGITDMQDLVLFAQLDQFASMFADNPATAPTIAHLRSLVPLLNVSVSAQDDYVAALASLVPKPRYEADEGMDDARTLVGTDPGHLLLQRLAVPMGQSAPVSAPLFTPGAGGAQGLGSTITGALSHLGGSIKGAAASIGDLFTYYTMKDRAGIVGRTGLAAALSRLIDLRAKAGVPSRIHLVGHSFGARVVTAAANALTGSVQSMTLLQAAFSHNAFSANYDGAGSAGAFRAVVATPKVDGPILITHSIHDQAVGIAYPLASRIKNQVASAVVGGPNDIFGGLGRNGAQKTTEVISDGPLLNVTADYPKLSLGGKCSIVNLNGDGPDPQIKEHGDVAKPEIARAMLAYTI